MKKIILFLFITLLLIPAVSFTVGTIQILDEVKLIKPSPIVTVPGLDFSKEPIAVEEDGGKFLYIPFLGEYLAALYKYAIIFAGVLSVVIIMLSGFNWVTSAGNSEKITDARKKIGGALIGLFIAVSSYTILYFINPNLVEFRNLKVGYVLPTLLADPGEDESGITQIETVPAPEVDKIFASGQCFPVKQASFDKISWNWGGARAGGTRCHAGIDLYTKSPGQIVSMDDGVVTRISKTFLNCKEGWGGPGQTGAIFIYHEKLDKTILYGEIDSNKITLKTGDKIKKGQYLGVASHCSMLHLEVYEGKQSGNKQWLPPSGNSATGGKNKCAIEFLSTKPAGLLDPTNLIKQIQTNFCNE